MLIRSISDRKEEYGINGTNKGRKRKKGQKQNRKVKEALCNKTIQKDTRKERDMLLRTSQSLQTALRDASAFPPPPFHLY